MSTIEMMNKAIGFYMDCVQWNYQYHSDWNKVHEVWEKVRQELLLIVEGNSEEWRKSLESYDLILNHIGHGRITEAHTALYNAIKYLNGKK